MWTIIYTFIYAKNVIRNMKFNPICLEKLWGKRKLSLTRKIILTKKNWKNYEDILFRKAGYESEEYHDEYLSRALIKIPQFAWRARANPN
jgi:hypothetical protein